MGGPDSFASHLWKAEGSAFHVFLTFSQREHKIEAEKGRRGKAMGSLATKVFLHFHLPHVPMGTLGDCGLSPPFALISSIELVSITRGYFNISISSVLVMLNGWRKWATMALNHQSKDTWQRTWCPPLLICSNTYLRHIKLWNPLDNNYVCGTWTSNRNSWC